MRIPVQSVEKPLVGRITSVTIGDVVIVAWPETLLYIRVSCLIFLRYSPTIAPFRVFLILSIYIYLFGALLATFFHFMFLLLDISIMERTI